MPIAIRILSGDRQGDCITLDADRFLVGDLPEDDVYFPPDLDRSVRGRRAEFQHEPEGWRIRSVGSTPILLNHSAVEGSLAIRSGDVVRMSEAGPDFTFTISSGTIQESTRITDQHEAIQHYHKADSTDQSADSSPNGYGAREAKHFPNSTFVTAGVVVCVIVLLVAIIRNRSDNHRIVLAPIADVSINEGEQLTLPVVIADAGSTKDVVYELDPGYPKGLQCDRNTGRIVWTPSENQGPGKYDLVIRAKDTVHPERSSDPMSIVIDVVEVNQPPELADIPDQVVDVNDEGGLDILLKARDPDIPSADLVFSLENNPPQGAALDKTTGRLVWKPTANQVGESFTLIARVSETSGAKSRPKSVHVTFMDPGPVRSVYLLAAEDPRNRLIFPYGTACAIHEHYLLTSATVAVELEKRRQSGWRIVITRSGIDFQDEIAEIKVHEGFLKLYDVPEEQIYFDLAILRIERGLTSICPMAEPADMAQLERDMSLNWLGVPHEAEALTRFDIARPLLRNVKVGFISSLSSGRGLKLLHLHGSLPRYAFGSPILDKNGKLVAVYAEQAELPSELQQQKTDTHYAPMVTLAAGWLAGLGTESWVIPEVHHNNTNQN